VLGSWPLAVTAYNHGVEGMQKARELFGTDFERIVREYRSRSFGFASRNFYTELLAALDVSRDSERYFGPLDRSAPADHEVVVLDAYYAPQALSRAFGVDIALLQDFNPALLSPVWRGEKHVPRGYALRLPRVLDRGPAPTLLASLPGRERFEEQRRDREYRVRRGDTLAVVARRFGVSERELAEVNGLRNRHRIRVGQVLHLPGSRAAPEPRPAPPAEPAAAWIATNTYRVDRGETLSEIARRLGVPMHELAAANGIDRPYRLAAGQTLRVPGRAEPPAASPERSGSPAAAPLPAAEPLASTSPAPAAVAEPAVAEPAIVAASPAPGEAAAAPAAASTPEPGVLLAPAEPAGAAAPTLLAGEAGSAPAPAAQPTPTSAPGSGPAPPPEALPLDPARFAVLGGESVVVQPEETLGHLAEWLEVPASRLRRLNGLRPAKPIVLGQRLRLDFSRIPPERFESHRLAFHRDLRERFFQNHRVAGTEDHVLRPGETLWEISRERYGLPVWLVTDYNPGLVSGPLRPGSRLVIPRIEPRSG
jgi:membrane-bound lytic murein transglycosylase D